MSPAPPHTASPDDATTMLLLAGSLHPADGRRCVELVATDRPAHVVSVTLTDTPAQRLALWERYADYMPDSTVLVAVGQGTVDASELPFRVETVDSPADLTRLGIVITEALEAGPTGRTVMCFRSLTALLQYASRETVCRFLDALVSEIAAVNARAHFHADPDALDPTTVDAFAGRLDAVVDTREPKTEV